MLVQITDPVVGHEYWKAGLLRGHCGGLWDSYYDDDYFDSHESYNSPTGEYFLHYLHEMFIEVED